MLAGRDYVIPDDVSGVFKDVAAHRLILDPRAAVSSLGASQILDEILGTVAKPVPR